MSISRTATASSYSDDSCHGTRRSHSGQEQRAKLPSYGLLASTTHVAALRLGLCLLLLLGCLDGDGQPRRCSVAASSLGLHPLDHQQREQFQADEEHQRSLQPAQPPGPDLAYDEEDELDEDDYVELNVTAEKWKYLGSPCDQECNPSLQHVVCDPQSKFCECEKFYPVELGPTKGCAKPKKLGEQCLYRATCLYTDQHSTCTQVQHNAVCECDEGYHRVPLSKSNRKLFCAADLVLIATDLPTLLGVFSGIAVFTGLICFVLKLFSRARYTRPRHYASAAGHPGAPILFSSDTGIPLAIQHHHPHHQQQQQHHHHQQHQDSIGGPIGGGHRPSSRSSHRSSSGGTINYSLRKQSCPDTRSGGANNNVTASRAGAARAAAFLLISCHREATGANSNSSQANAANNGGGPGSPSPNPPGRHRRALSDVAEGSQDGLGSRRPSLASIHSTTSSAKSYSQRRFERERSEKEQRQALTELKLKRAAAEQEKQQQQEKQKEQQQQQQQATSPSPSPRTPHSTDELLPSVAEGKEHLQNEPIATTSGASMMMSTTTTAAVQHNNHKSHLNHNGARSKSSAATSRNGKHHRRQQQQQHNHYQKEAATAATPLFDTNDLNIEACTSAQVNRSS
ncbi:myotubularin-related protein DDB_G0290005-like isoform X1 [Trichogramma pretiosum]|uniref:myotubularin-related protein DDB_G0290005-like isoform X1 n=1 Tax=Trichogramma pretiosum TaxID=7493 RepID=UPI0006C98E84|nr:myotubularin-related protein DDB_G0290005-like isoform X1 [Trichogramma pretiosum]